jgi:hypothetical protein
MRGRKRRDKLGNEEERKREREGKGRGGPPKAGRMGPQGVNMALVNIGS